MERSIVGGWQPVFVVGCPRSGTTLLRNLLRSHPLLTLPSETHLIPDFYRAYGDPQTAEEAERLAQRILGTFWIGRLQLPLTAADFRDCRSFRSVMERLYEAWARLEGKPLWGDKTPHYVMHIPLLARLFPEARFVHIYRDGRDVALSWLKAGFEPRNLYAAMKSWAAMVAKGMRDGRELGPERYLEVRYETLLSETEPTMKAVCDFLKLPWDEAVLRPNPMRRGVGELAPQLSSETRVASTNVRKWKARMSRRELAVAESVAGGMLAQLGYETNGLARPIPPWRELAWRMHNTAGWALYKFREKRWGKRHVIEAKLRARLLPRVRL